jgi:hypothetical protein
MHILCLVLLSIQFNKIPINPFNPSLEGLPPSANRTALEESSCRVRIICLVVCSLMNNINVMLNLSTIDDVSEDR